MTNPQPSWMANITEGHARVMEQMKYCPVCGKKAIEPEDSGFVSPLVRSKKCPDDHALFAWGLDRMGVAALQVITDDLIDLD